MKQKKRWLLPVVLQSVMRMAFVLFGYFALTEKNGALWCIAACAVLFFALMPGRFFLGRAMRGDDKKAPYVKRLRQGLIRFGTGIVFSLPLFGAVAWLIHAHTTLPFNKFGQMLMKFCFLVFSAPSMDTGVMGMGVFLMLLTLLALYGWRRQMCMEFLPDTALLSGKELVQKTARVRKKGRGKLAKVTFVNLLITLPCVAIIAAVVVPYVGETLSLAKGNKMMMLQLLLDMIKKPLPQGRLWMLFAAYAVVGVPLWTVRKMRIKKAVAGLEKE